MKYCNFLPAIFLVGCSLHAQQPTPLDKELYSLRLQQLREAKDAAAKSTTLADGAASVDSIIGDLVNNVQKIALSGGKSVRHYLDQIETNRQLGASGGASGSTSAVVSPLLADILGFSLERNSLLKTVTGSTVTFQVNPAGIVCATREGDSLAAAKGSGCQDTWKRVSFSLSFDQDRSNAPQQLVALRDQFSEARVHINLKRSSKRSEAEHQRIIDSLSESGGRFWVAIQGSSWYAEWKKATTQALQEAGTEEIDTIWYGKLNEFRERVSTDSRLTKDLRNVGVRYRQAFAKAVAIDTAKASTFAFEAGINRPDVATEAIANGIVVAGQRPPNLASARLIYSRGFGPMTLVANGSASWFTELLPGMGQGLWRDYMISGEARFRLRQFHADQGVPSVSFGGLVGDLRQAPLGIPFTAVRPGAANPDAINKPGAIRLFNARLEMPTANRNVVIPISFTYSNRTDLIKEEDVRGSIGISIRFDSLFPAK